MHRPLEILHLCNLEWRQADNIREFVTTYQRNSRHHVRTLSSPAGLPAALDLAPFDVLLLHYSLFTCQSPEVTLPVAVRARIAAFPGLKAVSLQDEYCWVNRTMGLLREMGVAVLFSCAAPEVLERLYPELPAVRKVTVRCGYVDPALTVRPVPPLAERPLDVVYRARDLPYWFGALAQEKANIGRRFLADPRTAGLRCDLSTRIEDRIYGEAWLRFLTASKATLGVESGASVIDFTGDIETRCRAYLRDHPRAGFEEVRALFFAAQDGAINYSLIPPRHLEAAALRTLMILYEAPYDGILLPWRHYLPLRRDHANLPEVLAALRDPVRSQEVVDTAYRELALQDDLQWAALAKTIDRELEAGLAGVPPAAAPPLGDAAFFALWLQNRLRLLPYRWRNAFPEPVAQRIVALKRRLRGQKV